MKYIRGKINFSMLIMLSRTATPTKPDFDEIGRHFSTLFHCVYILHMITLVSGKFSLGNSDVNSSGLSKEWCAWLRQTWIFSSFKNLVCLLVKDFLWVCIKSFPRVFSFSWKSAFKRLLCHLFYGWSADKYISIL